MPKQPLRFSHCIKSYFPDTDMGHNARQCPIWQQKLQSTQRTALVVDSLWCLPEEDLGSWPALAHSKGPDQISHRHRLIWNLDEHVCLKGCIWLKSHLLMTVHYRLDHKKMVLLLAVRKTILSDQCEHIKGTSMNSHLSTTAIFLQLPVFEFPKNAIQYIYGATSLQQPIYAFPGWLLWKGCTVLFIFKSF